MTEFIEKEFSPAAMVLYPNALADAPVALDTKPNAVEDVFVACVLYPPEKE